ncbi:MAG: hypothetical protein AAB649_04435, partial [Patescibacteria group bacterium]
MGKKPLILIFAVLFLVMHPCFSAAIETSLGGISLGEKYTAVKAKNTFLPLLKDTETGSLPYPINVLDTAAVKVITHPSVNLALFVDIKTSKIKALSTYEASASAPQEFETGAGLRVGDSVQSMRLLYGDALKASSYAYFTSPKNKTEAKIYYYPNLCVHTRSKDTAEIV